MPFPFYILLGAALTLGASLGLGLTALWLVPVRLYRGERWLFAFLLGSALWSTVVFSLAAAGIVYKGTLLAGSLLAMLVGIWAARKMPAARLFAPLTRISKWLLALGAPFFVLYLANAMAPEMSPDGSAYHLGLVSRYYREHGFDGHYENMYAHLSQGIEMLFLSAFAFGRHSAAAMVHFAFQCALPLLVLSYGRRIGSERAGVAAALLVYVTPVVGIDGVSAYNDVAAAAIAFGVFYLVEVWAERQDRNPESRFLSLIGLLGGYAFAVKYTVAMILLYTLARVIWKTRSAMPGLQIALWAAPMAAIWLIKNAIVTGNPLAPFFNAWFPNPFVTPVFEQEYRYYMRHYEGLSSYAQIPWEITFGGKVLNGFLGPIWLLTPLALFGLTTRQIRPVLLTGLLMASVYATNIGTRFLIPALPFLGLALALVLSRLPAVLLTVVLAHAVLSWPDIAKTFTDPYAWRLDRVWWKQALRLEAEDGFLRRRFPTYAAARLIEEKVPAKGVVLTYNQEAEAYTTREIRTAYQSTANSIWGDLLHAPLIEEAKPIRRAEFQFAGTTVRRIRLVQTATHPVDRWYVHELRVYGGVNEIPRASTWRLRASSNAAYVGLAFDNDGLTRWDSGAPLKPGMFLEIDFGRTQVFDRVLIEAGLMEQSSRLRVEVERDGRWDPLDERPQVYAAPPPLGLRRRATAEIWRQGIGFLLIGDRDFRADDYFGKREAWGLELLGAASGRKLYRILPPG